MLKRVTLLPVLAAALVALGGAPAAAQASRYILIVNPRNPIGRLSSSEVSNIFLGKKQAWDINGKIEPVLPLDQPADSPVRALFSQRVLRRTVSEAESYWRQELYAGRNVPPPQQTEIDAIATVRSQIGAIAYVSAGADLKGVKIVSVQ
jgi:ABC-type phosphate transport system substrate-binding protein